jgi:hypothetical protein
MHFDYKKVLGIPVIISILFLKFSIEKLRVFRKIYILYIRVSQNYKKNFILMCAQIFPIL